MSWQTPGKDAPDPTDPGVTTPGEMSSDAPATPEPDAETTRVPVTPDPAEPLEPAAPTAGLISAKPVGWADPDAPPAGQAAPDGPAVAWAPPVREVAPTVDGLVISRTFPRVLAYSVDLLVLGLLNLAVLGLLSLIDVGRDGGTQDLLLGIGFVVVDGIYFIGLWRSGWHATLGMRLLQLRILSATTAGTLSVNDALLRWIALSGAVAILALVPRVAGTLGLLSAVWVLVLFITTATNSIHQGLHDRWARSVVVQPAPGGSGAAVVTCLVMLALLFVVVPIAFLVFAGPQLEDILRQIGESI